METVINMSLQDVSPADVTSVGVRKPRSGSIRKPRSGSHTVLNFNKDGDPSLSGITADSYTLSEGPNCQPRCPEPAPPHVDDEITLGYNGETGNYTNKKRMEGVNSSDIPMEGGDLKVKYQSRRMGDLEDKNELKMFQRRERKRDDDRPYERNSSGKGWRDSDFSERSSSGKDTSRSATSPDHERMKKMKDFSEKTWKEKETYERRNQDVVSKDKDDYKAKSSWHWDKSRNGHPRKDRGPKDRIHRDREERPHGNYKDWDNCNHTRHEKHEKPKRNPEMNDKSSHGQGESGEPSNSGHGSTEQNNGSLPQRSSGVTSTGGYDSNSQHEITSGGISDQQQTENVSGGDARPIPKLKLKMSGISQSSHCDGRTQHEGLESLDQPPPTLKKRSTPLSECTKRRQRLILQEDSDEEVNDVPVSRKKSVPPSEEDGFLAYLADDPAYRRNLGPSSYTDNQNLQGVRKSSRVPKKRIFDGDDVIDMEPKKRRKKKVDIDSDEDLYHIDEDEIEHDFLEDEINPAAESKTKCKRRKSQEVDVSGGETKVSVGSTGKDDLLSEFRTGFPLTARQRALQSSKDRSVDTTANLVEFPEGLSYSGPKKQKEVLSAAERQLKKEEAAQKRRQQVEKAAKEIQAVAIQKILCQDSQRKKREGKLQKQRAELEQEKKAAASAPATNSIRWVFGPTGVVVSFSQDLELPKIFSGPLSYPQERERCAGPSCNNTYKYRDSKTQLPLCSLQCYKAMRKPTEAALAH